MVSKAMKILRFFHKNIMNQIIQKDKYIGTIPFKNRDFIFHYEK
jgi:hypothetical protein